jgi:phosphoribosylaminoimidazole carboxylase (NCAIR synthetase)
MFFLLFKKGFSIFQELAVILARGRDGSVCCFPVAETTHK